MFRNASPDSKCESHLQKRPSNVTIDEESVASGIKAQQNVCKKIAILVQLQTLVYTLHICDHICTYILSYMYINTIIYRCTILYNPRSLYSHYNIMILTGNKYSTVLCHWMELSPTVARKGAVRSGRTSYPCFRSHRPIPVETQASKERTFGLAGLKRSPCHVPPKQVTCYCVIITQERGESFQNEQLWNLSLCNRV